MSLSTDDNGDPAVGVTADATSSASSPTGDAIAGEAPEESQPTSQPMTATQSNSSHQDEASQSTYGTRSRNRPNGSRPNYTEAEDKDLDLEVETAGKSTKGAKKATVTQTETPAAASNGFAAVSPAASNMIDAGTAHAPGSGHYNVLPPPTSKKRKAPGSNTTVPASRSRNSSAPQPRFYVETNMMSFERCRSRLNNKKQLVADDGSILQVNDHVYFICEPPGEPYYLARIMEFLHASNEPHAPVDAVRVNWYYRPKDIQRRVQDTRVVFASMHSDTCPLTSIRGICQIEHYANISNLDDYRAQKDCFWFDKLYDRYMHRYYEVIPTDKVVNVPPHVKKVLDERWKFVLVEVGRGRDLTAASKKCRRCHEFAANHDSVDCAVCKQTYHMACVRPPLLKKPARGFAWACAACSRAQELAVQARNTPTASDSAPAGEDELMEDEDDSPANGNQITRDSSVGVEAHPPPTAAQLAVANLWPYRYLGIHSKAEDALDYDDRIYPRASSRLGPRHQANVMVWHGRPLELVKPAEGKRKYKPATAKKDAKATTTDADKDKRQKRPKWVVDEPPGYVARGHDEPVEVKGGKKELTAQVIFKLPDLNSHSERGLDESEVPTNYEDITNRFMEKVKPLAAQYGVEEVSTDFLTKAIEKLQESDYDVEKALEAMQNLSLRTDLKLPDLNREEIKRFEEGVSKYGSELHLVARHVSPTIKESRIVRYYYMWKKTDKGRQIWGSYEGRKSKKESRRVEKDGTTKLLDDVADDHDDSAFDNEKAVQKKRGFVCKFCETRSSRQWRRAPSTAPGTLVPSDPAAKNSKDKSTWLVLALCGKCAYLWRRYAIQYESVEEVARKIAAAGGRASKRRIDEELMRTVIEAQCEAGDTITKNVAQLATSAGVEVPAGMVQSDEPPKKKTKADKDILPMVPEVSIEKKKAEPEPLDPEPPRVKVHPCAVCGEFDLPQDKTLKCRDCRLHVHMSCYGVAPGPQFNYWYCDTCKNDHNTQVSTIYDCILCPVSYTPQELMEPPRVTHKKKTDREREKERLEREMVQDAGRRWRQDQEAAGRPVNPREPLKATASNNWIHVQCAVWTKEIKFGNPELLDAAEGMGLIPHDRYMQQCKICKKTGLPVTTCHFPNCNAVFHIGCAHQSGYRFGFDVAPVKGSRRDSVAVMKLEQEVGAATPAIWCSSHTSIPTLVHSLIEMTPSGLTAMQEYVRIYKQVDSSVTATARRAQQIIASTTAPAVQPPNNRRTSAVNGNVSATTPVDRGAARAFRSPSPLSPTDDNTGRKASGKKCCSCLVEASPRWWFVDKPQEDVQMTNGFPNGRQPEYPHHGVNRTSVNGLIKREPIDIPPISIPHNMGQARYQCHKCHVEKRTPPSSPSQVKQREKPPSEIVPDPVYFGQPPYQHPAATQPPIYPPARMPYDATHALPGPPPPPTATLNHQPPPLPPSHKHWPPPNAQWQHSPVRNGTHPPPAPPVPPPPPPSAPVYSPYNRPGTHPPPPAGPEFAHSYARPYGAPPPPPPPPQHQHPAPTPRPPVNGLSHHSPPPGTYGQPHPPPPPSTQPGSQRPPSPRGYIHDRPAFPSPSVNLASSVLSRPFAPADSSRPPSIGSPTTPFSGPPLQRPYQTSLPPPPPTVSRPPSAPSLVQIAQAATEHAGHSRHTSVDTLATPRMPARDVSMGSPGLQPATPVNTTPRTTAAPRLSELISDNSAPKDTNTNDGTPKRPSGGPRLRDLLS